MNNAELDTAVEGELLSLVPLYQQLHAHPELSGQEEKTSARLAHELRITGCAVTEGIGKYPQRPWRGYGVVAVMENGAGPTVLVRADMDALPIEEKTGLPYASRMRGVNRDGQECWVMHACGHDIHVTSLIGTARVLARLRGDWSGTLVLIGQPAEEGCGGADAMLADGAYTLFPKPDFALALHATLQHEAGSVCYVPGNFMASFTEIELRVRGIGAHGSTPEAGKDPVVLAAQLVLALQTILSREISPLQPAVLTVGSIHGGTASNIIPEEVVLQLSLRCYDEKVGAGMVASIERIAHGVALAAGVPPDRYPVVTVTAAHAANYNDPGLTRRVAEALKQALGEENVSEGGPVMASEDFGSWGLGGEIPTCMFWLGAADPAQFRESRLRGIPLPSHHSPFFAPAAEPTIRTGVRATVAAVLHLLGP